jgi:hypothetical protein
MDINVPSQQRVEHFRLAARYYPLDYTNRIASATTLSQLALRYNDIAWLNAAKIENGHVLTVDSTNAQVLELGILVDLALKDFKEANLYYNRFKQIDRKSQIHELVAQSHQQGRTPVAAEP